MLLSETRQRSEYSRHLTKQIHEGHIPTLNQWENAINISGEEILTVKTHTSNSIIVLYGL